MHPLKLRECGLSGLLSMMQARYQNTFVNQGLVHARVTQRKPEGQQLKGKIVSALFSHFCQVRKRNPNLNFLVRISSGGVGVFHVKGWGPRSSVCPSKRRKPNCSGGISRDFAGIHTFSEFFRVFQNFFLQDFS